MFVGHLAIGFTVKRLEPKLSLGTLMLAVVLADLLVFPLMITRVESFHQVPGVTTNRMLGDIPYSHSLLTDSVWAAMFAGAYFLRRRDPRGAWALFVAVLSHWLLDFVSHRPDMPLAPGTNARFGLGLWNSIPLTLAIEGGFWLVAAILYIRVSHAKGRAGVFGFWLGIALLTLAWYGNITTGIDPNPVRAGVSGLIFFSLMVAWAYWMNRVRAVGDTTSV